MPADHRTSAANRRASRRLLSSGGLRVARIAGIPVLVAPSWLGAVVLITVLTAPIVVQVVPGTSEFSSILVALALAVLLALSVLAHELGHCIAARAVGIPVLRVRLYLLGGVSELARNPVRPGQDAAVAAAGPGVSLVIAGLAGLTVGSLQSHTIAWLIVLQLALANAIVAVFNLLPALPLDGGHVLRAAVWRVTGRRRTGTVAAVIGGCLVAVGLLVWAGISLSSNGRAGVLQAAIAAVMAIFVAGGAIAEHRDRGPAGWPADISLHSLARPILQLLAETPVGTALDVAQGRGVVLTGADGIAVGLLDEAAAASIAARAPATPAMRAAQPLRPETVLLSTDPTEEVLAQIRSTPATHFLLVDEEGRPSGILLRADVTRILTGQSGAPGASTSHRGGHP